MSAVITVEIPDRDGAFHATVERILAPATWITRAELKPCENHSDWLISIRWGQIAEAITVGRDRQSPPHVESLLRSWLKKHTQSRKRFLQ